MVSSDPNSRFPPPWAVKKLDQDCFAAPSLSSTAVICTVRGGVTTISALPRASPARCDNDCEKIRPVWEAHMKSRLIFAAVMLVTSATVSLSDDMTGQASIIDGDTLEIHDNRIRLWGVDAPESDQLCRGEDSLQYRCGAKAANELDAFIAKRPVSCIPISLDQYGRTVATCSVGGLDLGEWLVRNGLALDWPQYSRGRYDDVQREAEHAGRGIWEGSYVEPWLFRVCIRAGGTPGECSDDANAHP